MTNRPLSPFESRWLAEATRLREAHAGRLDDMAANRAARAAGGDMETRLCHRASALDADKGGMRQRLAEWSLHATWAGVALAVCALFAGTSLGASVLGDGQRPVNVVWALGGLLGFHLLTLVLWCAGWALPARTHGSLAGRIWLATTQWLGRRHGEAWLPEAGFAMARRAGVVPAWLGRASQGLWTMTLGAALVTVLIMLSTRQYGFVWETTILSEDVFIDLVRSIGALPAALGMSMPDAEMVRRAAAPDPVATDRQVWSAWLIAALVLYGLLPRALLWAWSEWRWRAFKRDYRLDLDEPGYARLTQALMPASEGAVITDADPGAPAPAPRRHIGADRHDGTVAVALELGPDLDWPPPQWSTGLVGGRLDSREERRTLLDQLANAPADRLLVAIDTRLSPDRGSRALLAELGDYAGTLAIWLRGNGTRAALWRSTLTDVGVPAERQFDDETRARQWVEDTHA